MAAAARRTVRPLNVAVSGVDMGGVARVADVAGMGGMTEVIDMGGMARVADMDAMTQVVAGPPALPRRMRLLPSATEMTVNSAPKAKHTRKTVSMLPFSTTA
ncbi:MAG: hypothetical protein U0531_16690 [Dehalococcoidia bacterium]